jgi:Fe-S cluster assembly ATP-binding protein
MSLLEIEALQVDVDGKRILHGVDLRIEAGEVHAIMGPNGSGKSTLANVLAGHPGYQIVDGSIRFLGEDLVALPPHERAHLGLFLAFQYPVEIPGVSNMEFLKAAVDHQRAARGLEQLTAVAFMKQVRSIAETLELNPEFLKRGVNEGFSGGEKKRNEILQMLLLEPKLAVLDETDSGLDIDALQVVSEGVNRLRGPENAVLMITHYQRLLNHIVPDQVHVLAGGRIVKTGGKELAETLEAQGYGWLTS